MRVGITYILTGGGGASTEDGGTVGGLPDVELLAGVDIDSDEVDIKESAPGGLLAGDLKWVIGEAG
jgi:hypothetical protein